jgi:hypothetical protein
MKKDNPKQGFLQRLQTKWKLESLFQVVMVLVVFACTGFTILFIKNPILDFFWCRKRWISKHTFLFTSSSSTLPDLSADLWIYFWSVSLFLGKRKADFQKNCSDL